MTIIQTKEVLLELIRELMKNEQFEENMAYMELLFDICQQFGIRYYSATKKERHFVEEVTQVTWAKQQEEKTGVRQDIRPAFSA